MKASKAGIASALLASACCIGPWLLIAIGLGSGAAFLGRYHWFFLIGGLLVLTWAWVKYLREGRRTGIFMLLIATVIVLGFAGLNISRYVFASPPAPLQKQPLVAGLSRVVISVEGMTCATCEIAVHRALTRVPGVKNASVSVASKTAEIDFDPKQTTAPALVAAINTTGYQARAPQIRSN